MAFEQYRVASGGSLDLSARDPDDRSAYAGDKAAAKLRCKELNQRLEDLQELLYAEGKQAVLIVLQAMDAGGKDGTIRSVFDGVNPQGVRVASFKKPTPEELAHDYLWRVQAETPGRGQMTIFNRSHYEDVLVVRVKQLAGEAVWRRRYQHILDFERRLVDEGTTILKFFLHISKEEQRERLQERIDDPAKRWKFNAGDIEERQLWDDYMQAYAEALERTSTAAAPWYAIPANRNWYRNLAISQILVDALEGLEMRMPEPGFDPLGMRVE